MRILFLSDNFPPEVNAPASRTFEHCREWVKAGHEVTVITCAPNFPKGELYAGYRNRLWQWEELEGIRVLRVWSYIIANAGFVKRLPDFWSYMVTSFLAGLVLRRPDVIVGTSPQFFTNCSAWMLSVFRWRPFVFELRDLYPESLVTVGILKEGPLLSLIEGLELFLYRRAAAVVPVTRSFRENLVRRGIAGDKIHVVTNGIDLTRFRPLEPDLALRDALGIPRQAFVAGYIGTHGMAHALETVLEAARLVQSLDAELPCRSDTAPPGDAAVSSPSPQAAVAAAKSDPVAAVPAPGAPVPFAPAALPPIHFIMLGDGAEKPALQAKAAEMGLTKVHFLDTVPKAEVPRYWSLLDVAIIHLKKKPAFEKVIPSKLFESMGMGIPVLHGVAGESAGIVQREGVGLVFEPENAQALRDGLLRLAQDQALYQQFQARCLDAGPRYDRSALAGKMLEVLAAVAGKAGTESVAD
ncbi:MAG: glycosyltransferase [Chromatiaceae bacterium]|nr:glycosyltransferase [Chromatiaceae bacterium]